MFPGLWNAYRIGVSGSLSGQIFTGYLSIPATTKGQSSVHFNDLLTPPAFVPKPVPVGSVVSSKAPQPGIAPSTSLCPKGIFLFLRPRAKEPDISTGGNQHNVSENFPLHSTELAFQMVLCGCEICSI